MDQILVGAKDDNVCSYTIDLPDGFTEEETTALAKRIDQILDDQLKRSFKAGQEDTSRRLRAILGVSI